MLKKLFHYEWKACWRLMAVLNAIVLVISVIGIFVFRDDFWYMETDTIGSSVSAVTILIYFMFYVVSVAALGIVVSLYFYIRFYNNLYTDQGYLMHTLPVKPWQLIWSKAFVGLIWQFISVVVMLLSIFLVLFNVAAKSENTSVWDILGQMFGEIFKYINTGWFIVIALLYLLVAAAGCCMTMFLGYTAISIAQLFKKHKIIGAIGVFIGIYTLLQFVAGNIMVPFTRWIDMLTDSGGVKEVHVAVMLSIVFVGCGLITTGLYFLNEHIMKYKLNLE